ncbi:MAG: hypothetical protein QOJ95_5512, partial [Mycobacterium sp.]|nr:hypothetical protein [Mycobacterium sp.]
GAAFVIAGSVGIACAVITLFLRQPKVPEVPGSRPIRPQDRVKRGHPEEASLALD